MMGVGAICALLGGNTDSAAAYSAAIGRPIAELAIDPDANRGDGALRVVFADGFRLLIEDQGRSCCESRWMHTDDDLSAFVGATFCGAEVAEGPTEGEGGDPRESAFLRVLTSRGDFTVVTYNHHNGYYGGIAVQCREEKAS